MAGRMRMKVNTRYLIPRINIYYFGIDMFGLTILIEDFKYLSQTNATLEQASTGSQAMINLASYWLLRCLKSHSECTPGKNPVSLPRILIDVGIGQQTDVSPFLYERSMGETGYYFALSYRWGTAPLMTKRGNFEEFKRAIPMDQLPTLMKDAILLTQRFGCRYLWVDALCIVQDDFELKEAEIKSMEQIYRNSSLTIAAAVQTVDVPEATIFHMRPVKRSTSREVSARPDNLLDMRGWILQEQVLSTRVLSYTVDGEMYWTCNGTEASCSHPSGRKEDLRPNEKGLGSLMKRELTYHKMNRFLNSLPLADMWENNMYDLWMIIVTDFTNRSLSVENDRLAALAGISSGLERCLDDELLAGHWRSQLANSLAWCVDPDLETGLLCSGYPFGDRMNPKSSLWRIKVANDVQKSLGRRPTTFEAPTWSWASVLGPISYSDRFFSTGRGDMWKYSPTATIDRSGSNPYLTVVGVSMRVDPTTRSIYGALTLQGSLMTAEASMGANGKAPTLSMDLYCTGTCEDVTHRGKPSTHSRISCNWLPDVTAEWLPQLIHCFHISGELSLCLIPTGKQENEFQRVGICIWKAESGNSAELECLDIVSSRLRFIRNEAEKHRSNYLRKHREDEYIRKRRRAMSTLQTIIIV